MIVRVRKLHPVQTVVWALLLSGCRQDGAPEPLSSTARPDAPAAQPAAQPVTPPPASRAAARPIARPMRAIWIARYHYNTPADVIEILNNCRQLGADTVLWQARGEAVVSYPSQLEPWAREFDFKDPGFDPLALAVAEAHRLGMRIEAWVNVMPGWKGATPPPVPGHVFNEHPDWFLHDAAGKQQPLNQNYVILNPCYPEVRRHIVAVFEEIASRYDIDGLHLDYVRYAWDSARNSKHRYPRDAATLAAYERDTGRKPDDDAAVWDLWRANQLTRLVDDTRRMLGRVRPGASLTAAVWRNPRLAYNDYLQNAVVWLRSGLLDAIMPMAYTQRLNTFELDIEMYRRAAPGGLVVPGVGLYQHRDESTTRAQLELCRRWGGDFALFSYESLFPTLQDRLKRVEPEQQRARPWRVEVVRAYLDGMP